MTKLILNENVDYSAQYNSATTDIDRQNIIYNFIDDSGVKNLNDGAKSTLNKFFKQQGAQALNDLRNPIIQFLLKFNKFNPNTIINETICDYIIRLYGEGIIKETNLLAKSFVGTEDIIFVVDLYNKPYDGAKYICQVYYWLNNESNTKSLNLDKIFKNNEIFNNFCENLAASPATIAQVLDVKQDSNGIWRDASGKFVSISKTPKQIANMFCFVNMVFDYNGVLRNPNNIAKAIDYIDTIQSDLGVMGDEITNNVWDKLNVNPNTVSKLSQSEIKSIIQTLQKLIIN